jgi:predicted lipoprotein with Yx(FWY)xxD motif
MTRITVFVLTAVLALGAGAGIADMAAGATTPSSAAKVRTRSTSLGTILVNGKGATLYLFKKDTNGRSACSGACAQAWPPLLTKGRPTASGGVSSSKLGTTRRSDGTRQVTYNRHPLYTFIMDRGKPGSTAGQGLNAFGAKWYVVGTNGNAIVKSGG